MKKNLKCVKNQWDKDKTWIVFYKNSFYYSTIYRENYILTKVRQTCLFVLFETQKMWWKCHFLLGCIVANFWTAVHLCFGCLHFCLFSLQLTSEHCMLFHLKHNKCDESAIFYEVALWSIFELQYIYALSVPSLAWVFLLGNKWLYW